jgi:NitT/TauT family transport system permease protein
VTAAAAPVGVPLPPQPSRSARWMRAARYYLPAALVFVGALAVWELLIGVFAVRTFILPAPSAIGAALVEHWSSGRWPLAESARNTLYEAFGGLVIGTVTGVIVAFAVSRFA